MRTTVRSWIARTLAAGFVFMPINTAAASDETWIQAASIAPGEGLGRAHGFSAWLRLSDVGAGAGGDGHEVTILRVMSPAQFQREGASKLYRINFRCRVPEYIVVSSTSYDPDGTESWTLEGDGLVRTYQHNGLRGVADAVCTGVTPASARSAGSLQEAVAVAQYDEASSRSVPDN